MNTVLANGLTGAPNSQQELFVCPAEYAIAELSLRVKYGRVRGINSATCRHVSASASNIVYTAPFGGSIESGSSTSTTVCPTGYFAHGIRTRAGWFTDALGLRCRDF